MLHTVLSRCRIFRYAIVGGIAFIADTTTLYGLTAFAHLNYLLSAVGGFMVGLALSYLLSLQFVFHDIKHRTRWTFQLFCIVGLIGLALNELIIGVCTEFFGLHYMYSKMVSVFLVFWWNYGARKKICFQEEKVNGQCNLHSRSWSGRFDSRL